MGGAGYPKTSKPKPDLSKICLCNSGARMKDATMMISTAVYGDGRKGSTAAPPRFEGDSIL